MPRKRIARTMVDSYEFYVKRQKRRSKKVLSRQLYMKINKLSNLLAMDKALEGYHVVMPYKLGILKIIKVKTNMNNLKIDFAHYNKTGEKRKHLNIHSDGFYPMWVWKGGRKVRNSLYHTFTIAEQNRKAVSKVFKEPYGHKRYLE